MFAEPVQESSGVVWRGEERREEGVRVHLHATASAAATITSTGEVHLGLNSDHNGVHVSGVPLSVHRREEVGNRLNLTSAVVRDVSNRAVSATDLVRSAEQQRLRQGGV